jgi:hypothetical protein
VEGFSCKKNLDDLRGHQMKKLSISTSATKAAIVGCLSLGLIAGTLATASAATKITCYKGSASKVFAAAKCPTGYSSTKPSPAKPSAPAKSSAAAKPAAPAAAGANSVAINATYKAKLATVWTSDSVSANVSGAGSGNTAGLDSISGSGNSAPANQCDPLQGSGILGSGANTLKVSFDTSTQGCAADGQAPTTVSIVGPSGTGPGKAIINGGTGKFAGASGTLSVTGSFAVKATDAGTKDSTELSLSISGTINLK